MSHPEIKLRESDPVGRVIVFAGDQPVFSDREYRTAAEWAQRRYGLTDEQLLGIYRSYKDNYDGSYEE